MAVVGEERMHSAMSTLDDSNQALHMVEELGEATKEIIALMDELECHNKAFQSLKERYSLGNEKVHHAGELMPGQEIEDLVITDSQYSVVNTHCPISGKPVESLDDPVRSLDCSHIYDRLAVMDYLRKWKGGRRPCPCAIAGCPKPLVQAQLVCDTKLKVELQELRMRGRDRINTRVHDVADCTEADDFELLDD